MRVSSRSSASVAVRGEGRREGREEERGGRAGSWLLDWESALLLAELGAVMEPLVGGAGGEEEGGEDSLDMDPMDRAEGRLEDSLLNGRIYSLKVFLCMLLFRACSVPR